jgi:hypothetical protein
VTLNPPELEGARLEAIRDAVARSETHAAGSFDDPAVEDPAVGDPAVDDTRTISVPVESAVARRQRRERLADNELSFRGLRSTQRFEARKVRRLIRHVDPWSAFKLAFLLLVCTYLVMMTASVIVWSVAVSSGTIGKLESFTAQVTGNDFKIDGLYLFRLTGLLGLVITLTLSAGALVGTIAFNLISDLIGGVWITVIEEESARPASGSQQNR